MNFCIFSSEIWLPEISVVDLVEVARLDLNEDWGELKVRGDKTINLIHQMRVKIRCQLDLKMFPHDYQVISCLFLLHCRPYHNGQIRPGNNFIKHKNHKHKGFSNSCTSDDQIV